MFIVMFPRAHPWSFSWNRWISFTTSFYFFQIHFNIILPLKLMYALLLMDIFFSWGIFFKGKIFWVLTHQSCHQNCNNSDKIWLMQRKTFLSRFICVEYKMWNCRKNALQGYIYYLFLAIHSQPMFPSVLQWYYYNSCPLLPVFQFISLFILLQGVEWLKVGLE